MHLMCSLQLSTTSMVAAASSQSNTLKAQSTEVNASVSGGFGRFSASASTSFGKATSVGVTKVNSTATSSSSEQSTLDAIYSQYVRVSGVYWCWQLLLSCYYAVPKTVHSD